MAHFTAIGDAWDAIAALHPREVWIEVHDSGRNACERPSGTPSITSTRSNGRKTRSFGPARCEDSRRSPCCTCRCMVACCGSGSGPVPQSRPCRSDQRSSTLPSPTPAGATRPRITRFERAVGPGVRSGRSRDGVSESASRAERTRRRRSVPPPHRPLGAGAGARDPAAGRIRPGTAAGDAAHGVEPRPTSARSIRTTRADG